MRHSRVTVSVNQWAVDVLASYGKAYDVFFRDHEMDPLVRIGVTECQNGILIDGDVLVALQCEHDAVVLMMANSAINGAVGVEITIR
ncbi:hypothetical protein D3C72_2377150 [compost metagenome]